MLFFVGRRTGMTVGDVQQSIEAWAPREIAFERDNTGLQCGDPAAVVRGILVALDPTEEVVLEAQRINANVVITHHPLLFHPARSVTPQDEVGRVLRLLLKADSALVSAHTNLDFARGGTSFALAEKLGLQKIAFLHQPHRITKKIVTFVPLRDAERVAAAMAEAGAGIIGNYDYCSFSIEGTGRFRGSEVSSPTIGRKGSLEQVQEVRLEMVVPSWNVNRVVEAMRGAHPYEEVAYDVYTTENRSNDYGMGVLGTLPRPVRLETFLRTLKRVLGTHGLRFTGRPGASVQRVAACGGSGADLLPEAVRRGAEVFVTADVKYHSFRDAAGLIVLVDAGHFETEFPVVDAMVKRLTTVIRGRGERIPVRAARRQMTPVQSM
jgi:dinuclear metal center YbgI/SA1388 family protein